MKEKRETYIALSRRPASLSLSFVSIETRLPRISLDCFLRQGVRRRRRRDPYSTSTTSTVVTTEGENSVGDISLSLSLSSMSRNIFIFIGMCS